MRVVSQFAARVQIFVCLLAMGQTAHAEEKITSAAAADFKFWLTVDAEVFAQVKSAALIA